jgi:cyclase
MTKATILSLFILFAGFMATAQDKNEKDKMNKRDDKSGENYKNKPSIIDVTDNIFMLKGMGGNVAVQDGIDGIFMIDTQFENTSEFIKDIIERKTDKKVEFIANTHFHGDHTGGNKNFSRKGATIIAHKNVRALLTNSLNIRALEDISEKIEEEIEVAEQDGSADGKIEQMKQRLEQTIEERAGEAKVDIDYEALPAISFEKDLLFHYNDEDIKFVHLPNAHTNSDIIVYFPKSNVMHTGDAFVNGMYPYLDTENGGSYKGYLNGLKKIVRIGDKDTKIIPGHGDLAKPLNVQEMMRILELYYSRIKFAFLQNKTEDQVAAMRDFTKFYDDKGYGDGFITTEKILRKLYQEVEKNEGKYKRENDEKDKKNQDALDKGRN